MKFQNCPICEKEFKVYANQIRKYCSKKCLRIGYKEQLKGEKNPNYRHGPKLCEICGGIISKNADKYCSGCIGLARTGAGNAFFGKTHSEETKKKMSDSHPSCSGEDGNFWGKKHTDETKLLISQMKKEKWESGDQEYKDKIIECLRNGTIKQLENKGNTLPERIVEGILIELDIKHTKQSYLYNKFFVDFLLNDGTIIEVFGDYWHGNEEVFETLNSHQIKQKIKDKSRISYLNKCGHNVIILWEKDIKKDIEKCKMTILARDENILIK